VAEAAAGRGHIATVHTTIENVRHNHLTNRGYVTPASPSDKLSTQISEFDHAVSSGVGLIGHSVRQFAACLDFGELVGALNLGDPHTDLSPLVDPCPIDQVRQQIIR